MATRGDDVGPGPLERLYERWTLEVVPALAPAAAALFKGRPQRFKQVGAPVVESLARFHYRTGYDDTHLESMQRQALIAPLLGESDGIVHEDMSEFHRTAGAVRMAAVDFAQRSEQTGEAQLRAAFRDTVTTFARYLTSILGAVVDHALLRTEPYFDEMVTVLQSGPFAGGFGLPPAPSGGTWPFELELDGDGAVLIEEIGDQAASADIATPRRADQAMFIITQRIGHFGRRTIQGTLASSDLNDAETDALIDDAYRWWTALRNLRNGSPS